MKFSHLGLRITAPLVLIASLAIGVNAALNYARFERTFTQVELARMRFLVNDITAALETGTRLGLPIQGLANAQSTLTSHIQKDPSILSVSVFDGAGIKAFHAGQELAFSTLPTHWLPPGTKTGQPWSSQQGDGFAVAAPLHTSISAETGWVVLRYQRQSHDSIMQTVSAALWPSALAGALITALLGLLGIDALVKLQDRHMRRVSQALKMPPSAAASTSLDSTNSQAIALAHGASASAHQTLKAIGQQTGQDSVP